MPIPIRIRNKVQIPLFDKEKIKQLSAIYTHLNPDFFKMTAMGYYAARDIKSFEINGTHLILPRGRLREIGEILAGIDFEIIDERIVVPLTINFTPIITLTPFQNKAVTDLSVFSQGILVSPTGSGKTYIGLDMIRIKKQNTLILMGRDLLLKQWKTAIKDYLGREMPIGEISGSRKEIKPVTLAMIQSLSNFDDNKFKDLNKRFGMILVEECQHIPASALFRVINKLDAKYRFGLSATEKRKDRREFLLYDTLGTNTVNMDDHYDFGGLIRKYKTLETSNFEYNFDNDFTTMLSSIVGNIERNRFIMNRVIEDAKLENKILVITERVQHAQILYNMISESKYRVILLTGALSVEQKEEIKIKYANNDFDILVATRGIIGEGIDIPILNCLHLVTPSNNFYLLKQMVGRVLRKTNEVKTVYIRDYSDTKCDYLRKIAKKRSNFLKKMGFIYESD